MWNERYNRAEYVFGTEPNDFLKENFQKIPLGGKVLCLAEGEGRNAVFLAEQGYQVTAMDMSNVGLNKALKLAQDRGVDIITQVADLAHYELVKHSGTVSLLSGRICRQPYASTFMGRLHQRSSQRACLS